ncbi:collagen-like protein [Corallococcus exercitus]|uniref:Collagen-like protein n=1 Tax=Corallococcus exercitus TaxID=2316736 RepID=A0A7Y4JYW6_9BACT|nr:collagen-like protein [Corallococcus exercitus]
MAILKLVGISVFLFLFSGPLLPALAAERLVITNTEIDYGPGKLLIYAQNIGRGLPVVELAGVPLVVQGVQRGVIVAAIPRAFLDAPGSFLLTVSFGPDAVDQDAFDLSIGSEGPQGPKGDTGLTGAPGAPGPKGDTGLTGAQGAPGPKGDTGLTGAPGAPGPKGDTGLTGAQGPKGDTGLTGAQGPKGDTGLTGAPGAPGPKGDTGLTGAPGPKGDTGLTGAQGPKGDTGLTGAQGAPGAPGPKGDTGLTGAQGPAGLTSLGSSFVGLCQTLFFAPCVCKDKFPNAGARYMVLLSMSVPAATPNGGPGGSCGVIADTIGTLDVAARCSSSGSGLSQASAVFACLR